MPHKKRNHTGVIAPSILSADFSKLGTQMREVIRAGCTWIHLDIMDNHFVPNLTFGPPVVKALRKVSRKAFFDAHLMVEAPETLIEPFAAAGVENLTVHHEACPDNFSQVLLEIRSHGMQCGVSIKPETPLEAIRPFMAELDLLLVMTVEPGFGGQELIPKCLNKIRDARRLRERHNFKFKIQADGGINEKTASLVVASGAEVLVAGSAVFNDKPVSENVLMLMKSMNS